MAARKSRVDGERTRAKILAEAEREFAEKGYELASVREISRRAGVNTALANRYFGSKEALYRIVAKRLFGDLGAPMTSLPDTVTDDASWRAAIREWVDDFLFMTLPAEPAQTLCAALFRHEVTHPTKFHVEFLRDFGKPVYDSLRNLLARAIPDETQLELWTTSIWAQVSVYALADKTWHASFRPEDVAERAWAEQVRDHICATLFASVKFPGKAARRA
jgi:AcrR family transcriptional regulator